MQKRNLAKECDFVIMLSIFLIAALYGVQLLLLKYTDIHPARINQGITQTELLILAGGVLWKAYRLNACAFTKIAVWMYITLVIETIVYIIIPFGYKRMLTIGFYIFMIGIAILFTTYLVQKWIGTKSSKT